MYVGDSTLWEIVVNHEVDAHKVDATPHELRADENPNIARPELLDRLIALHTAATTTTRSASIESHLRHDDKVAGSKSQKYLSTLKFVAPVSGLCRRVRW